MLDEFLIAFLLFQSTLPREERQPPIIVPISSSLFQSTLPREERLCILVTLAQTLMISIHAPTRGATVAAKSSCYAKIFQSTLPREERLYLKSLWFKPLNFNPRSHERSDGIRFVAKNSKLFQSTLPREERL